LEKIFSGIFWSKLHGFLRLSLVCLTESRSFGYGLEDLISLHKVVVNESFLGPLKLMTSQVVQGTWLKKGGSGVNVLMSFLMSRHVNFECDHSDESCRMVLCCGAVFCVVQGGSKF